MSVKLIYGPPGIGKSTLIRELKLMGKRALDLETFDGSAEQRELVASMAIGAGAEFIAMADVPPHVYLGPHVKKVLLCMSEANYARRRRDRDMQCPWKSNQRWHNMEHWLNMGRFDVKVDVTGPPWDAVYALIGLDRIL